MAISKARTGFRIFEIRGAAGEYFVSYCSYYRGCPSSGQSHRLGITQVCKPLIVKELREKFLLGNRAFRGYAVWIFRAFE